MIKTRIPGIYRRGKKYVVTYRDRQGVQRKESRRTLKEASLLKSQREVELEGGFRVGGRMRLLSDYAEKWMEDLERDSGRRERTIIDYQRQVESYVLVFFNPTVRLGDIYPGDIDRFISWLMGGEGSRKKLAPATVRRILVPFRLCLEQARRDGLIDANPVDGVKVRQGQVLPKKRSTIDPRKRAMTRDELAHLLKEIPAEHSLFFRTLAATGARWSESIAWRAGDLVPPDESILVERTINQKGKVYPPKTNMSRRSIPLSSDLFAELKKAANGLADGDYIFQAGNNVPFQYPAMKGRVLDPAASRAGLEWVGFHTFRHTAASILFDNGLNIKEVQTFLGHSTPGFTLNTYVHLIKGSSIAPVDLQSELRLTGNWP